MAGKEEDLDKQKPRTSGQRSEPVLWGQGMTQEVTLSGFSALSEQSTWLLLEILLMRLKAFFPCLPLTLSLWFLL
ncbi:hypothetical protein DSO57_1036311 [Entomophthora muscae]|uniref:Uncharacterized protein n=1 Tax=Entomophthora muscae TaxID=34485 RepID=A0ACC2U945_9FUNG|nr:hypothetical protein DSO57_1036311 [Entomophthora muscae]